MGVAYLGNDLFDAKVGSTDLSIYLGGEKVYPSITQFDFLEAPRHTVNGSDYGPRINSGFTPTINTEIEVSIEGTATNQWSLFGVRESNGVRHIQLFWPMNSTQYRANFSNRNQVNSRRTSKTKCTLLLNKLGLWIDNSQVITFTQPVNSVTFPGNLWLFSLNNNGKIEGGGNFGLEHGQVPYKIYYIKIRDNNTLVRDFRPAKYGNEAGMVDLVNNVFYKNQVSEAQFYVHNISTKIISADNIKFNDTAHLNLGVNAQIDSTDKMLVLTPKSSAGALLVNLQNITEMDYAEQPYELTKKVKVNFTSSTSNTYAIMPNMPEYINAIKNMTTI